MLQQYLKVAIKTLLRCIIIARLSCHDVAAMLQIHVTMITIFATVMQLWASRTSPVHLCYVVTSEKSFKRATKTNKRSRSFYN